MFRRKESKPPQTSSMDQGNMENTPIKYPKPQILLVDVDSNVAKSISKAGFNAFEGSFGAIYKVPRERNSTVQISLNNSIPLNLHEMDIVIIDLAPTIHSAAEGEPL